MAAIELYDSPLFDDANLVSYWRLEGNMNDSKNSNNGTNTNMSYNASYGKFGQGARFNGSTSGSLVPHNANLSITSNLSISFWMKWNGTNGGKMVAKADTTPNTNYCCYNNSAGQIGKLAFFQGTEYVSTYLCPTDEWIWVVYTVDGTALKIYVNAVEKYSQTIGALSANTGSLGIGVLGDFSADGTTFGGDLDDIAIFNKTLTPTEILDYYNGYANGNFFMFM